MSLSRREVLLVGGTAVTTFAGCTTISDIVGTPVTVASVKQSPAIVVSNSPDSIGTHGIRDEQFVLITVTSGEDATGDGTTTGGSTLVPDRDEFALEADGDSYSATPLKQLGSTSSGNWIGVGDGMKRVPENFLLFQLPNPVETDELTLQWPGGKHTLDGQIVEAVSRPPTAFAVELTAPDAVANREEVTVTLDVQNEGEVRGTFVGALNRKGGKYFHSPIGGVSLTVEAGESRTWTHSYTPDLDSVDEDERATFTLGWRRKEAESTIRIDPAS
jgi:hypothetical protein